MIGNKIHTMLKDIAQKTYPDKEIKNFFVELIPEERKSFHGDYNSNSKKIRIFNLSRKTEYIITTSIHELAHHIDSSFNGNTSHDKRFYEVYKELLETAVKMGIVTYEKARTVSDAADIRSLEKYFGEVTVKYDPEYDNNKNKYTVRVVKCYGVKDILKQRGYQYNDIEQSWCLDVEEHNLESEKQYLYSIIHEDNVKISSANNIEIEAVYYIIVAGGFEYKDILKDNGYFYKGYNIKDKVWVKKIKAHELREEEILLKKIPKIEYRIEGISKN